MKVTHSSYTSHILHITDPTHITHPNTIQYNLYIILHSWVMMKGILNLVVVVVVSLQWTASSAFHLPLFVQKGFQQQPPQWTQQLQQLQQHQQFVAAAVLSVTIWSTPNLPFLPPQQMQAVAKELASGSGSRVNKDPESLLRLGLPISNKEVRLVECHQFISIKSTYL